VTTTSARPARRWQRAGSTPLVSTVSYLPFGPEAQDPQGFDREAFQAQLSGELVEFFSKALR